MSLTALYRRIYTQIMKTKSKVRVRPRHVTALRLSPVLWEAMDQVRRTAGIPITWQLERAAVAWLKQTQRISVKL